MSHNKRAYRKSTETPPTYVTAYEAALGKAIRAARVAARRTQADVADRIGCHRSLVSHIERARLACHSGWLPVIARAIRIPLTRLLAAAEVL